MAAKRKETPTEQAAQIGKKKLMALLKAADEAYKEGRSIAGAIGEKVADAIEHDHLHRKAFAMIRQAKRMTPEKLADWWDTLQYYMDISGLEQIAKNTPRLPLEDGEDEGEGEEDDLNGNIKPFPTPGSVAAE